MRTHVEFRSAAFPPEPDEEEAINPGRWGRRLAAYLRERLPQHGFAVDDVIAEDWGYLVALRHAPFPLWVGCGNYDEHPDGFLCFIEPYTPTVWRWFRRHDTREVVERLAAALDAILTADPATRDLRWWSEDEAR